MKLIDNFIQEHRDKVEEILMENFCPEDLYGIDCLYDGRKISCLKCWYREY